MPYRAIPASPAIRRGRDSLANQLAFYVAPGLRSQRDLVSGQKGSTFGAATWAGASTCGPALSSPDTTSSGASWPLSPAVAALGTSFSIAALVEATAWGNFGAILSIPYAAGTWTSPYAAIYFSQNNAIDQGELFYAATGGVFTSVASASGYILNADPAPHLYAVVRTGAAVDFYRDGIYHSSATLGTSTAPDFSGGQPVCLSSQSNTAPAAGRRGATSMAAIWSRALKAAELARLASDPFAPIRPASPSAWLAAAAATGGATAYVPPNTFDVDCFSGGVL